jgi:hypothetical protein
MPLPDEDRLAGGFPELLAAQLAQATGLFRPGPLLLHVLLMPLLLQDRTSR